MTKQSSTPALCPVERAGGLDNRFRKWLQNPEKILSPYVKPGMDVLDVGCGPGYFSLPMAELVENGSVTAADLQAGMLQLIRNKIRGTALETKMILHPCHESGIGLNRQFDFILAFYMIHEVRDKIAFLQEIKTLMKPNGKLLIVEPKFHVKSAAFAAMEELLETDGFELIERPKVFFSRAVLVKIRQENLQGH